MPIVNDLLTGNRRAGPRVFLHLNWHATEICMPCKYILRFRHLPTSAASRLACNKKLRANAQKNRAKSANRGHSSKPNLPSFSVCNKVLMRL